MIKRVHEIWFHVIRNEIAEETSSQQGSAASLEGRATWVAIGDPLAKIGNDLHTMRDRFSDILLNGVVFTEVHYICTMSCCADHEVLCLI